MNLNLRRLISRRVFLKAGLVMTGATLAGCDILEKLADDDAESSDAQLTPVAMATAQLNPTPACDDGDDDLTAAQTAGPFYTPDTPERINLVEAGITGTSLVLVGQALTPDCQPIAGAMLDFWHCDDAGIYDNVGFKLRGHQYTDDQGYYRLETILPGVYPGRTRHIHVRAMPPNGQLLTTQLYFPNEAQNASDGLYMEELLVGMTQNADGSYQASFDFVLA